MSKPTTTGRTRPLEDRDNDLTVRGNVAYDSLIRGPQEATVAPRGYQAMGTKRASAFVVLFAEAITIAMAGADALPEPGEWSR